MWHIRKNFSLLDLCGQPGHWVQVRGLKTHYRKISAALLQRVMIRAVGERADALPSQTDSTPTAPTGFLINFTGLAKTTSQQKAALTAAASASGVKTRGTDDKPTPIT